MIRYAISRVGPDDARTYLMACYEPGMDGIVYTYEWEDACHYVTVEKAASVARQISTLHGCELQVCMVPA